MNDLGVNLAFGDATSGFNSAVLAPIWQLNGHFLDIVAQSSRHPAWPGSTWEAALGSNLAERLPGVLNELARSPISLVDIGLSDSSAPLSEPNRLPALSVPAFLPPRRTAELAQVTLTLAWTLARSDPVVVSIVFGLSQSQVQALLQVAVQSIPMLAERLSGALRPRWLGEPHVWRHLLGFSGTTATARLAPVHIRALQRQFADLVPATRATRSSRELQR